MRKIQQGFTLIELMIVVAIIGILAAVAIPNYQTYTKKAKFTEVVQATSPFKLAVEGCFQDTQDVTSCYGGNAGVPTGPTSASGYVASVTVAANGTVTAAGNGTGLSGITFTLSPTPTAQGTGSNLVWTKGGTCAQNGLC